MMKINDSVMQLKNLLKRKNRQVKFKYIIWQEIILKITAELMKSKQGKQYK